MSCTPHDAPTSDTAQPHTRTRARIIPTRRHTSDWRQHKSWIREAVITGQPLVTVARQYGIHRATAWALCELPTIKRYVASLRRWQSDRALQARIERDATLGEVSGADDVLK